MTTKKEISNLMKHNGFVLIRTNKHNVWEHKTIKRKITTSVSPSDYNAIRNIKKDINNLLAMAA
jgi:hypothetical protein